MNLWNIYNTENPLWFPALLPYLWSGPGTTPINTFSVHDALYFFFTWPLPFKFFLTLLLTLILLSVMLQPVRVDFFVSRYSHIKQRIIEKCLLGRYEQNCFETRRKSSPNLLGLAIELCKVHAFFDDKCYILKKCIALARSLSVGQEWFSNKRDNTNKDLHPIVQSRHSSRTAFSMSE